MGIKTSRNLDELDAYYPSLWHRQVRTLPPKPPSICSACWEGPFAAHLGLLNKRAFSFATNLWSTHRWAASPYAYTTSRAQLERAAAAGCVWCQLVLRTLRYSTLSGVTDKPANASVTIKVGRDGSPHLYALCTPTDLQTLQIVVDGCTGYAFSGHVHSGSDNPVARYIVARSPILDVGSTYALDLADACIVECMEKHELCRAISCHDPLLPTRLVDCTDPDHPRLTPTERRHGKYLALSYVWGEAQPHQTTTSNLSTYMDGIALDLLPQTLRDAINVTHSLGFQYLWVDSLCIVQDSGEDTAHEIGRMHLIYRYAHLTIIAACSKRVSEGFLQRRPAAPHDIPLPFICPVDTLASESGVDGVDHAAVPRVGTLYLSPDYSMDKIKQYSHAQEPISARGWCLQELYMSPRALVFTSETLQFRCQTATQNVRGAFYNTEHEHRLPPALFRADAPPVERGSEEWLAVRNSWCRVVEDYTGRTVGKPSDKLVACGAIAEAFHRAQLRSAGSDYLAGLWRDTLLEDLLWGRHTDDPYLRRAPEFRAPSWSWAAVDGRVRMWGASYLGPEKTAVAEVLRADVVLEDHDLPFGRVAGGSVVLRAGLVSCDMSLSVDGLHHDIALPPSRWRSMGSCGGICCSDSGDKAARAAGRLPRVVSIDDAADVGRRTAWLVPLLQNELYGLTLGLAVAPVTPSDASMKTSRDPYRRIGFFKLAHAADSSVLQFDTSPLVDLELL